MEFWTAENLRSVLAGRWLCRPPAADALVGRAGAPVCTDSRTIQPGQIFMALRGGQFDGHDFLAAAAAGGASMLVIDHEPSFAMLAEPRPAVLLVPDVQAALIQLAAAYRRTFQAKVIAITGSVGKTSTKQLLYSLLASVLRGKASPKSFNNHIGVPLTLMSVEPVDQFVVVEIGTNAPGEIAALARIAQPDIAVITPIGASHLAGLGSIEGVRREKASLLSYLKPGGLAVVHGDSPGLADYRKVAPNMIRFGRGESCDLRLTDYTGSIDGGRFEVNRRRHYSIPLLGEHNAVNALAALAVARHMNLTEEQIEIGLARTIPPLMRLTPRRLGEEGRCLTLLDDSYNANPESMRAALKVLGDLPTAGRRVAILGDMAELGSASPEMHRALGESVLSSKVDLAVFIGKLCLFAAETFSRGSPAAKVRVFPAWTDQTPDEVARLLQVGDLVLVKASRSTGLERLIPAIERQSAQSALQPQAVQPKLPTPRR
jgi:UDP-N-acetylmuramoyl-tripeptide--D-alanyl-D-alanine ligase